jgi:NAD(P)-dependent dehydrogenase (short-subunit alcohol dehydrogenase family)
MGKLDGRSAIITGASQGLGKAIAAAYLREGANVVICARDKEMLEATAKELAPLAAPGRQVIAQACDVSKPADVQDLVGSAILAFPELDIVVNSAGIYGPKGTIEDVDWADWVKAIEINLYGTVLLARAIVPHLKKLGRGKFVQLSGGGATNPLPRLSAYAASKAAVVRFCETLAHECAEHHIDVNCIAPGALNTRMLDEVLEAGPDKVGAEFYKKAQDQKAKGGAGLEKGAALAVFLGSRDSDGITGRLLSAVWDPWQTLPERSNELAKTDIYTLRRIVPAERGKDWDQK